MSKMEGGGEAQEGEGVRMVAQHGAGKHLPLGAWDQEVGAGNWSGPGQGSLMSLLQPPGDSDPIGMSFTLGPRLKVPKL